MKHLTLIAAAIAALSAAPAFAASNASATVGPIQITLFDLNPFDDVAPSITFNNDSNGYNGSYAYAYTYDSYTGLTSSNSVFGTAAFEPVTVTSFMPFTATATSSVTGDGTATGTTISASGTAFGTMAPGSNASQYASYSADAYAPYFYSTTFTVSTGTAIVISVPTVLSTSVTNTYDSALTYGYEYAYAYASMSVTGAGASGNGYQNSSDSVGIESNSMSVYDEFSCPSYCYIGSSNSSTQGMAASFINISGGDLAGQLFMQANVNGYSYAQAVPEPGTYALLLAGLGAVGFLARRRRA